MPDSPPEPAILKHLRQHHSQYAAKAQELRATLQKWLTYSVVTFPNFTNHTIDHSDEIIRQLSRILFTEQDRQCQAIKLNRTEQYILVCAAYLHDAGMVVAETERRELLSSKDWTDFLSLNHLHATYDKIMQIHDSESALSSELRHYLADLQLRYLIGQYYRGRHHSRAASFITTHAIALNGLDYGDPLLRQALSDICVGHGIPSEQLQDPVRYPESRDICGETVNVRLLAILLRIGDLLDLRTQRACPLVPIHIRSARLKVI